MLSKAAARKRRRFLVLFNPGQMQLWKVYMISTATKNFDNYGEQSWMGGVVFQVWDVQNDHATTGTTASATGLKIFWDKEIPERFRDVAKYGTPAGLSTVMR